LEANDLVVVPWPQPQPTKHLSAPRLFNLLDRGFLPYDVYGGDLARLKKNGLKMERIPKLVVPIDVYLWCVFPS